MGTVTEQVPAPLRELLENLRHAQVPGWMLARDDAENGAHVAFIPRRPPLPRNGPPLQVVEKL